MLEHDEVALARAVRHQRLQLRAERVEQVPGLDVRCLGREEPDPFEPGEDPVRLAVVRELANFLDLGDERAEIGKVSDLASMLR